jgi:endonuclease YncB( thermonuclease family)
MFFGMGLNLEGSDPFTTLEASIILSMIFRTGFFLVSVLMLLLAPFLGSQDGFFAQVNGVYSGDTISVRKDREQWKIRVRGILCPDPMTELGRKAKRYASALVSGKLVHLKYLAKDEADQVLARVIVQGEDLAVTLLQAGLARYHPETLTDPDLGNAESLARTAGIGIWSSPPSPAAASESDSNRTVFKADREPENVVFDKIKYVEYENEDRKEREARLTFTDEEVRVTTDDGKTTYLRLPYTLVTEITYERSAHPRWESIALPSVFGTFGDRKKHWLTILWTEEGEDDFALLRLDKDNYQQIIAACESRVGVGVRWIVDFEERPF